MVASLPERGPDGLAVSVCPLRLNVMNILLMLLAQFQKLILLAQFPKSMVHCGAGILAVPRQIPQPDLPSGDPILQFSQLLLSSGQLLLQAGALPLHLLEAGLFGGQVILTHGQTLGFRLFQGGARLLLPFGLLHKLPLQVLLKICLVLELLLQALHTAGYPENRRSGH